MAEGGHSERPLLSFRLGAIRTPRSMSIDHVQTATPLSPPLSPQPTPASWRKQSPQAMIASLAAAAGSDASSSLASLSSALNVTLPPSAASAPSSTTTSTPLSSSTSSSALPLPPLPTHPSSAPSSLLDVMQRASGESKHLMARIYIEESSSCTGMFVHPELTVAEVVTELLRKECRKHFGVLSDANLESIRERYTNHRLYTNPSGSVSPVALKPLERIMPHCHLPLVFRARSSAADGGTPRSSASSSSRPASLRYPSPVRHTPGQLASSGRFSSDLRLSPDGTLLVAGSIQEVLEFVMLEGHPGDKEPEPDLMALLLCLPHYTTPAAVMQHLRSLLQFYDNNIVMSLGLVNFRERLQHFLQVAHSFPRVWRDDETHDEFLRGISELGNQVFAGQLDLTRYSVPPPLLPKAPARLERSTVMVLDFSAATLAAQLTLHEAQLFRNLQADALLHKNSPALTAICDRFNLITNWVATMVLMQPQTRQRIKAFRLFLSVCKKLFRMRSYSTCMQIFSGLTHISVSRLKRVTEALAERHTAALDKMREQFGAESNYRVYRSLDHTSPRLPFLAVWLRDMTFIADGNPLFYDNQENIVNFDRWRMMARSIDSLRLDDPAATDYSHLPVVDNLYAGLYSESLTALDPDQLYELSLKLEPLADSASSPRDQPRISPREHLSPRDQLTTSPSSPKASNLGLLLRMEKRLATVERENAELRRRLESLESLVLALTNPPSPTSVDSATIDAPSTSLSADELA